MIGVKSDCPECRDVGLYLAFLVPGHKSLVIAVVFDVTCRSDYPSAALTLLS